MRFNRLSLLLVLMVSACTFQVDVLDTPTAQRTEAVIVPASSTPTSFFNTDLSATPAPTPTLATTTNTALPAPVGTPGMVPIKFGPNGTYADVLDSILAGKSKMYSVNALKGQVMSVSFHQNDDAEWTYITMRIIGTDGVVLCASDCEFWRGVLPATEDYFVTVTPSTDALDFMMRVAINPPGAATQTFLYENKYRNASLSYTDMFAPTFLSRSQMYTVTPELVLQFIDSQSYANTNLIEAYFLFGSSTDEKAVSTCLEPVASGGPETLLGEVTIDGVTFTKSQGGGVGAGNIYEQTYFRAVHNATCFEITYDVHYGNIGNYEPGTTKEFDQAALIQKFDQTLSTLVLK